MRTTIQISNAIDYRGGHLSRLKKVVASLEEILNSDEFKSAVLEFRSNLEGGTFHFKKIIHHKGKTESIQLKRFSNEEILKRILYGNSRTPYVIDLKFKLERGEDGDVIGYKRSGSETIHTYQKFVESMSEGRFAAHILHEYCHIIGFSHSFSAKHDPYRNCYSVPYAIHKMLKIIMLGPDSTQCKYPHLK